MLRVRQLLLCVLLGGYLVTGTTAESLQFDGAWSPEAPPVAPVMAGYVRITNAGADDMTISTASCPDFNSVEIHDMLERDGMMRMIKQEHLRIPAGETVELKNGGLHLMLMKPRRAIKTGETLDVTFETTDGEAISVPFEVKPRPTEDTHQHHHHH